LRKASGSRLMLICAATLIWPLCLAVIRTEKVVNCVREMNSAAQNVCSFAVLCEVCVCHGTNVAGSAVKKFSRQECRVKGHYRRVETCRVTGSLPAKNKIRKLVFFVDDAWFTLSRNVEGKSNR
jgi:1-aminocyclopropane-1-carboxylate deaminase/D-cysteine desulfhydrase-like pyridoxal-dependent ACC family enzyme